MPFPGGLSRRRASRFLGLAFLLSFLSHSSGVAAASSYNPFSAAARCPLTCTDTEDYSGWSIYSDISKLSNCNQTVLLDLNLNHGVDADADADPDTLPDPIRACAVSAVATKLRRRQSFSPTGGNQTNSTASQLQDVDVTRWGDAAGSQYDAAVGAATAALAQAVRAETDDNRTILFAQSGPVIVGVYAGSQIGKQSFADVVQALAEHEAGHAAEQTAAQLCSADSLNSEILGIFIDTTGSGSAAVKAAKAALAGWNKATCLADTDGTTQTWSGLTITQVPGTAIAVGSSSSLAKRDTCSYTQAVSGDGCWSLADRCGITQDELLEYNGDANLCSDVVVGQYVCCSAGTLPDFTPQPNADGTCKSYTVQSGDYCAAIAEANTMTVDEIESRNADTWGWAGCSYLLVGQVICLSTGDPPMPGEVANAVCGPTVPGTERPDDMSTLADLNPCPLDVCCNVWGQCGITDDFCVASPADTGAPGTATPGSNGCVASCGMTITNNDEAPASFKTLGYWEAWNSDRACLHMKASQIDTTHYTHLHFAFGTISDAFEAGVGNLTDELAEFTALTGVKRILSFGGWSFSTDYDTYPIFREGVTADQRQTLVDSIVAFVADNDLDGVDFDWEYPGATDIPGIPAGSADDGANYLAFLKLMRAALPDDKTVAIAAPASYWYLRGFPIADIADVVDYIVYMTYDLHGQWDYGNSWSDEGCSGGDCLRSHINLTETETALAMITHAGVQASKVVVGMALYGRSFEMTTAGCYGPDCTYVGPDSGATPGRCTATAGYISNFEIRDLLATSSNVQQYSTDDGDLVIYDDVQWVSWLTQETYDSRVAWVQGLNFGGTSDWAIDLDADYSDSDAAGEGDNGSGPVYVSPDIYSDSDPVIQCYPPCTLILPPMVLPSPTTITIDPITVTYKDTWSTTVTVSGAIITTSVGSTTSTVITLPPITTQTIPVSNVVWDPSASNGGTTSNGDTTSNGGSPTSSSSSSSGAAAIIWLTSSIIPPPVTITQSQTRSSGTPIVWTFSPGPYPTPPTDGSWPPPPPPPSGFPSTVVVSSGAPKPTCEAGDVCGSPCLINCGTTSGPGCLICGCIGPFCPDGNCVGAGCIDTGGSSDGSGGDDSDTTCRKRETVSYCDVECSVLEYPSSTTTTCQDPECTRTITACSVTDSTSTTTTTLSCPSLTAYDYGSADDDVAQLGDGADGGVIVDLGDFDIPPETVTVTSTVTPIITTTQTVVVVETVSADCGIWDAGFFYQFEVYNIQHWATDGGAALKKEEKGCGALTGWDWTDATSDSYAKVYFNLPFLIKDGCVERAIVSAGGPKLSCKGMGIGYTSRRDLSMIDSGEEDDAERRRSAAKAEAALEQAAAEAEMRRRAATTEGPSRISITDTPTYTYDSTVNISTVSYVPMTWGDNDTIVLTWTLTDTDDLSTTTYTSTIPGYTYTGNASISSWISSSSSSSSLFPPSTTPPSSYSSSVPSTSVLSTSVPPSSAAASSTLSTSTDGV